MIDIFDKLNAAYGDQTLADSDQIKDKKFGKKQDVLNKEILDPDDPNSLKSKVDSFNGIVIDPDPANVVSSDKSDIEVGSSKIPTGNAVAGALNDIKEDTDEDSTFKDTQLKPKDVGIDDEPTTGSDNLVKSGGVSQFIDQINLKIDKYSEPVASKPCKNEQNVRYHVDIPAGDYTYIGRGEQWAVVNFYKNGLLVYTLNNGNIAAVGVEYNFTLQDSVDEIGAYVGGTEGTTAQYGFNIINRDSIIKNLEKNTLDIQNIQNVVSADEDEKFERGILPNPTILDNYTQNTSYGGIVADPTSNLAVFLIKGGHSYMPFFDGHINYSGYKIAFFSAENPDMSSFISGVNAQKEGFVAPANAKSIQINIEGTKTSSFKLYDVQYGEDYAIKLAQSDIQNVISTIGCIKLTVVKNKILNPTYGSFQDDANTDSARGSIIGGKTYCLLFDNKVFSSTHRLVFYKGDDFADPYNMYISGTSQQVGAFTAPDNAKGVAVCVNDTRIGSAYIVEYNSLLEYIINNVGTIPSIIEEIGNGDVSYNSVVENRTINGTTGWSAAEENTNTYRFIVKKGQIFKLVVGLQDVLEKDYWLIRYAVYSQPDYYGTSWVAGTNIFADVDGKIQIPSEQDIYYVAVAFARQFSGVVDLKLSNVNGNGILNRLTELEKTKEAEIKPFTQTNNVLWLGTSIPEGCTYPYDACVANGLNCINKAVGSSSLGFNNIHPDVVQVYSGRELTATVAELEALYRQDVTQGVITEDVLEGWKNGSYERCVLPYINGTNEKQVSMIVIDHGFNDRARIIAQLEDEENINWDSVDRNTFTGAFRYLLNKIQAVNPFVKIVIAGYFTNTVEGIINAATSVLYDHTYGKEICKMQQLIAEHYNISIIKVWEHSQISNYYIDGTSEYVDDFNETYNTSHPRYLLADVNGNPITGDNGNISAFQLYCMDGIHPFTDRTGNANKRLNAIYSKLLKRMI